MKKIFFLAVVFMLVSNSVSAKDATVSAKSAILIETSTKNVLYEKNAYTKMPMASTTKIMTAICALENLESKKVIKVDDGAVGIEGSSIYLSKDEEITIEDLIYGMMLSSGNDAATALAFEARGSVEKFSHLMNETAKRIGAKDTNFKNACGLYEDQHYTTAYDLALITAYGLKNEDFAKIVSTKEKNISNGEKGYPRVLKNHNRLLRLYDGCTGVKTGYTKKCGRCLVTSAKRDGVELVCVTLNAPDDWNDHMKLLDKGFSMTKRITVAESGDYFCTLDAPKSMEGKAEVVFERELSYVDFDNGKSPEIKYDLPKETMPSLKKGEVIGEAHLYVGGELVESTNLISSASLCPIPSKPFIKVFEDYIKCFLGLYIGG